MNPIRPNGFDRLKIGVQAPAPINHVSEELLSEVAEVLLKITRHPRQCISKKQLIEVAEKGIAQTYILERRVQLIDHMLKGFREQAQQLPEGDGVRVTFEQLFDALDKILKGEHK